MRHCGVDFVRLFHQMCLVPLDTKEEFDEAKKKLEWLNSRTELSKSAMDYKHILGLLLKDFVEQTHEDKRDLDIVDSQFHQKRGRPRKEA